MMKRSLINRVISVAFILLLGCLPTRGIQAAEQTVDVQEIVFSHIQDAYTWHITEWNEKERNIHPFAYHCQRGTRMGLFPLFPFAWRPNLPQLLHRLGGRVCG